MSPFYSPRYAIGVTPAIMLLVALGVRRLRPRLARYGAVGVLAVVSLVPLVSHLRYTLGTPYWREATSFINRQALQGETVLVNRGEYVLGLLEYYKLRPDLQVRIYNDDWSPQEAAALIRQDGGEHLWLLVNEMRRRQEITKVIEAEYSLAERSEYQRGVLLLSYKRNGAR